MACSADAGRATSVSAIQLLPSAILDRVLLLALPVDVDCVVPEPCESLPVGDMQTLALVCRDWHMHVARLHRRVSRREVDLIVARKGFCVKRAENRCVNPTMLDSDAEIVRVKIKEPLDLDEQWTCDWHAVMRVFPNVRRLDLSKISIRSRHVAALLDAASAQCGRVEALILTHVDWHRPQVDREHRDVFAGVWEDNDWDRDESDGESDPSDSGSSNSSVRRRVRYALQDWFDEPESESEGESNDRDDGHSEHSRNNDDDDEYSDGDSDFDDESDEDEEGRVLSFGDELPPGQTRYPTGHELDPTFDALYAALERWYTTGKCGGLRQLLFVERRSVDRVDDNNALIQAVTKFAPRMEYLDGSTYSMGARVNGNWVCDVDVWDQFCRTCVSLRAFDWRVVPFSDLYLLPFAAVPRPQLRSLMIGFEERDDGFAIDSLQVSPAVLNAVLAVLPALEVLGFDGCGQPSDRFTQLTTLLTDDLVATLVTCCPRLRKLEWLIGCQTGPFDEERLALTHFTDASLARLATLPLFEKLHIPLSPTACTEDGLLAFARSNGSAQARSRTLQFQLDPTGERRAVLAFLDRILEEDTDVFAGPSLQMVLKTKITTVTKDDVERLEARLASRNVHAFFNRTFAFAGAFPIATVVLHTSQPDGDATVDDDDAPPPPTRQSTRALPIRFEL